MTFVPAAELTETERAVLTGQQPIWNPALLSTDLVLPIVDLGQDNEWQLGGASQWVSAGLIAAGWILATTAAAGATRVLKRG